MPTVSSITKSNSPLDGEMLRISCNVIFEGSSPEILWIDYPVHLDQFLDGGGNPWVIMLLPNAVARGEPLNIDLPVDSRLLENLRGVQQVWASWYDWANPVKITARTDGAYPRNAAEREKAAALFFTGGVDSSFSLIQCISHRNSTAAKRNLSLISILGFDIAIENKPEFEKVISLCDGVALKTGSKCIALMTNLRSLDGYKKHWGPLSHGAALAGIGHLFSGKFDKLFIGSTHDYSHLHPWGSHPLVDPLFSSADLEVVHDGATFTRVEKTAAILGDVNIASRLRVCYKKRAASNCSECSKCLRTMATIDLLEKKELATSFDWNKYSLEKVANVYLANDADVNFFLEIRDEAIKRGRTDLLSAVEYSLAKSRRIRFLSSIFPSKIRVFQIFDNILDAVSRVPFLWRLVNPIRRLIIRLR